MHNDAGIVGAAMAGAAPSASQPTAASQPVPAS
jgi:hypothetical protein